MEAIKRKTSNWLSSVEVIQEMKENCLKEIQYVWKRVKKRIKEENEESCKLYICQQWTENKLRKTKTISVKMCRVSSSKKDREQYFQI